MRALVIGGTQYFGRSLVRRLLARGDNVTLYTRGKSRPEFWDQVEHILGDRTDRAAFRTNLAGREFDLVFDQQAYHREDVQAAAEALKGRVGRYVFTSTGSTYHEGYVDFLNTCPFPESALPHSRVSWEKGPGESDYASGKRQCEKYLLEHPEFPWTVVRVPAVMGPDDPTSRMWFFVQRAMDGGPLLWPVEEQAPWRTLYREDAATSLLGVTATERTRSQIYHVAMEEILTPERWVAEVWRAAGKEPRLVFVPGALLERLLPRSRPYFSRNTPYIQDLRKSREHWGYRSSPFSEWIAETVRWYRDEYRGPDSAGYADRAREIQLAERFPAAHAAWTASFEPASGSPVG